MLETHLSYKQLMEDTPEEVLEALIDIMEERAEQQEEENRRKELANRFS